MKDPSTFDTQLFNITYTHDDFSPDSVGLGHVSLS